MFSWIGRGGEKSRAQLPKPMARKAPANLGIGILRRIGSIPDDIIQGAGAKGIRRHVPRPSAVITLPLST